MESIFPLKLPPGLHRSGTTYQAKGRWIAANLVRFHEGAILPVGGWVQAQNADGVPVTVGTYPRAAYAWRANSGTGYLAVGTTGTPSKLYAYADGALTDITPAGLTDGAANGQLFTGTGGWGTGGWGDEPWNGAGANGVLVPADTWQIDSFGELPVFCLTGDGKLYSWDLNTANDAAQITDSPEDCRGLVVTNERFLFALGAGGDPRKVQWPARETLTTWTASATNNAGSFLLSTSGRLVAGRRGADETLLWTDADLWGARFIGGTLVYSFGRRGDQCGLIGPNAIASLDGVAYWMGRNGFFNYAGAVRRMPCEVADYVFSDFSREQAAKVFAVPIHEYGEVWWFYPSASQSGLENDRYVATNPREGWWVTGELARAAGVGSDVWEAPMLVDPTGALYNHETGLEHGSDLPYIESGPLEIGDGERTAMVQRVWPDELALGSLRLTVYSSFAPTQVERTSGPVTLTDPTTLRVSGRQFRFRFEQNLVDPPLADGSMFGDGSGFAGGQAGDTSWRLGDMRVGYVPGGRR